MQLLPVFKIVFLFLEALYPDHNESVAKRGATIQRGARNVLNHRNTNFEFAIQNQSIL